MVPSCSVRSVDNNGRLRNGESFEWKADRDSDRSGTSAAAAFEVAAEESLLRGSVLRPRCCRCCCDWRLQERELYKQEECVSSRASERERERVHTARSSEEACKRNSRARTSARGATRSRATTKAHTLFHGQSKEHAPRVSRRVRHDPVRPSRSTC